MRKSGFVSLLLYIQCFAMPVSIPRENNLLQEEITHVIEHLKTFLANNGDMGFYRDRELLSSNLRELLLSRSKDSRLFSFPVLDKETFNSSIQTLQELYANEQYEPDLILFTWSLLSGIKVIGLREAAQYYFENRHLAKYAQQCGNNCRPDITFSIEELAISDNLGHNFTLKIPRDLDNSSVYLRSTFGNRSMIGTEENAHFVYDFFYDEVVPLRSISEDFKLVKAILGTVLRFSVDNPRQPLFSLGLTTLFQNTAIYLSPADGRSRNVVSPCSVATINYLGLQDGIFIQSCSNLNGMVEYLFGIQFLHRYFDHFYKSTKTRTVKKTEYYPHYSPLSRLENSFSEEGIAEHSTDYDQSFLSKFGKNFKIYLQGQTEPFDPQKYSRIADLIKDVDMFQLEVPLISTESLEKEEGGLFFEPADSVDLSSEEKTAEVDRHDIYKTLQNREKLLRHLEGADFQGILKINISGIGLTKNDALKLTQLFKQNVLPRLEELNISNNSFGNQIAKEFVPLLNRYPFKILALYGSERPNKPQIQSDKLLKKIIWVPKNWVDIFSSQGLLDQDQVKAHKRFHKIWS